jgi:hypothetical protein
MISESNNKNKKESEKQIVRDVQEGDCNVTGPVSRNGTIISSTL